MGAGVGPTVEADDGLDDLAQIGGHYDRPRGGMEGAAVRRVDGQPDAEGRSESRRRSGEGDSAEAGTGILDRKTMFTGESFHLCQFGRVGAVGSGILLAAGVVALGGEQGGLLFDRARSTGARGRTRTVTSMHS